MKTEHRKKVGRPKKGAGVKVISLSVEKKLLERADAAARRKGISRAELVATGLELALAKMAS
jgi:metal-responsive CopG/Arc/MetJ family transcriptional regulator